MAIFLQVTVINREFSLYWGRFAHIWAVFIPAFYILFALSLIDKEKLVKKALIPLLFLALVFSVSAFHPKFLASVSPRIGLEQWTKPGLLYPFFIIYFLTLSLGAFYILLTAAMRLAGRKRNQLIYVIFASGMAFLGGATVFSAAYGIRIPVVHPYGLYLVFLSNIIIAYAILRYRLMDVEVIIRETAVYAGIFGFAVGIFVLAITAGQQALLPYTIGKQWLIPIIALLVVTFAVRPIERLIYNTIGKVVFKKRHEYQKALKDAAVGMSTIRDPKKLINLIIHLVSMKIRIDNISVLIYDEKVKKYTIKASRGANKLMSANISISHDDPLIEWVKEKKGPLALEDFQRWTEDKKSKKAKGVLTSELLHIEEKMKALGASVCIPSFYRNELLGIFALGNKKSGDFFTRDELNLLNTLADEAVIAIKNSQLYSEIGKRAKEIEELYLREHKLFMHASVAFAAAIDARDPYTHGHSERVTSYSTTILNYMWPILGMKEDIIIRQRLQVAAVLHDIGKIGVRDDILHKPGKLTPEEHKEMEKHSAIGAEIVSRVEGLRDIVSGIKHHHERYDGKGYPDGIKSENIPFMARIIAVADTYDAMTSNRPYRKGMSDDVAKEEIKNNSASQFDPYVVAAFLKAFEEGEIKPNVEDKMEIGV